MKPSPANLANWHARYEQGDAEWWDTGRYAQAYHRLLPQPDLRPHYARRKTSVEPFFDLFSQVLALVGWQKQLPIQGLSNIQTLLTLGVFSVQIAFLVNSIGGSHFEMSPESLLPLLELRTPLN